MRTISFIVKAVLAAVLAVSAVFLASQAAVLAAVQATAWLPNLAHAAASRLAEPELDEAQKAASAIQIERAYANLPEVTVYLQLDNSAAFSKEHVTASLGNKPLNAESLLSLEDAGEGTTYFFLVDCSTSIYPADMDGVKQMLIDFNTNKSSLDRLVLITFGERVDTILDGSEDAQAAAERIGALVPNQNATLFNDAVIRAMDLAESQQQGYPVRKVVTVISDGVNYDEAAGSTEQELLDCLGRSSVPLYALCLPSSDRGADPQAFGQLARRSGGDIRMADGSTVSAQFANINAHIAAIKVLRLYADDNIVEASEQQLTITIRLGEREISNGGSRMVATNSHIPDTEPPIITRFEQLDGTRIRLYFSEPVLGADRPDAYLVTNADHQAIAIVRAAYSETDGVFSAELTLEGRPYSGSYQLETQGISDCSMEKNPVAAALAFDFEGQPVALKILETVLTGYWWAILLAVLILIVIIVFRVLRKRKGLVKVDGKIGFGDALEFKHHFQTPQSRSLRLVVIDTQGTATQVDLDVDSSVFIGRAKANNLSFDDTKMSRQHFVIEAAADGFYISDLQSANGTFLNGQRLSDKRLLKDGDTITAGHEKFVYQADEAPGV